MDKIRRISFFLRIVFILAFIILPCYVVWFWLSDGYPFGDSMPFVIMGYHGPELPSVQFLSQNLKIFGFLLNLIPLTLYLSVLYFLIRLFSLYGKGKVFEKKNAQCIRYIGWLILIYQIVNPFYSFLLSYLMTLNNPFGYRFAFLGINVQDILLACVGIIIILTSWIMEEGHKIHEEQTYTV